LAELKKGTIYLFIGWIVQILAGYCLTIWLGRILGPEGYGTYGVVMSILLWIEVGAISGFPTSIQKFVSAEPQKTYAILKTASRLQFYYILILFIMFFGVASIIAKLLKDMHIQFYIRIAIWDIWLYGYFFILMSLQNGLKHFRKQALLMGIYAVSKLFFVIFFVSTMKSVTGAFIANIAGSMIGLIAGIIFIKSSRISKDESIFDSTRMLQFAVPVALYSLLMNLFLNVDLWIVKYFLGKAASGYYVSASTIARVPYYMFFALSATVLPLLSSAIAKKDILKVQQTIQKSLKFLSIVIIPISMLTMSYSREIVILLFKERFAEGGEILKFLIWGMSFMAFYFLLTTIINADNKPRISLTITGIVLMLDICLNVLLIPVIGITGAAISTTISLITGSIIAGTIVIKRFKIFLTMKTILGIMISSIIIFIVSKLFIVSGITVIIAGCGLLVLYGSLLLLMRVVSIKEVFVFSLSNSS
jgi:stage V sporulation protein B